MAYVIAEPCIGVKDRACVEVCPVDCIGEASAWLPSERHRSPASHPLGLAEAVRVP